MPKVLNTDWDLVVSGDELDSIARVRSKELLEQSVSNKDLQDYLDKGWEIKKENKTKTTITKSKPIGDAFEDEVWSVMYKMGFKCLNKNNKFAIVYDERLGLSKQIDVFAMDDETCLFIECKAASKDGASTGWNKEIGEMASLFPKLKNAVKAQYPDKNLKFKYIFATKNYTVGDQDKNRLEDNNITYFSDSTVLYYKRLADYLGTASRYQLLGSLFAGTTIAGMDATVPAIRGYMGKKVYYTFLIRPEDLLKIGYVLHRTNANNDYDDLLPSYQRLIKKDRLNKVREFVNAGGYFPNSVIISVDSKRGGMQFDPAGKASSGDKLMKMGMLHLPQVYQSAYIIDGQHRLYGYSDSDYSEKNTIPVVAFDGLPNDEQLKLFMEINENQKAVPKSLRNILEIDIYYDSDDKMMNRRALLGKITKHLGEDSKSPLSGRIIIGEDAQTEKCCLTIDYIKAALEKTNFVDKYDKKGKLLSKGIFDKDNNDATFKVVYQLVSEFLSKVRDYCNDDWDASQNGFITKNNMIVALIMVFGDIVGIVLDNDNSLKNDTKQLLAACNPYILKLCETLKQLTPEAREIIRKHKGASAKEQSYHDVQMAFYEYYPKYTNDAIENYYANVYTNFSDTAKLELSEMRDYFAGYLKEIFVEPNWNVLHMDEEHCKDFAKRISDKKITLQFNGDANAEIDEWQELNFSDFSKIVGKGTQWTDFFKDKFAQLSGEVMTKQDVVALLKTFDIDMNNAKHGKKINRTSYDEVHKWYKYMCQG